MLLVDSVRMLFPSSRINNLLRKEKLWLKKEKQVKKAHDCWVGCCWMKDKCKELKDWSSVGYFFLLKRGLPFAGQIYWTNF